MTREEAINEIRTWAIPSEKGREVLETLIPELAESEDERIRKCIGMALTDVDEQRFKDFGTTLKNCLAYLEKQKEQKPVECIEFDNEFEKQVSHLLASVLNGEWEYNEGFVKHAAQSLLGYANHELELDGKALLYTADKSYQIGFRDGVASVKPAEWSKSDKDVLMDAICATDKLGNNEVYNKNNPNLANAFRVAKDWLKNLPKRFNLQPKQEWSEEDEKDVAHIIRILDDCYAYGKHDLSKTDHENLVGTLKSLRLQPKLEWSEEDEHRRDGVIQWLREYQAKFNLKYDSLSIESIESLIDWLKSIRPSWKPSEQEKGALRTAIYVLTEERNFPKAAAQLQNILDAFEGKESRKDWKPSEHQMNILKAVKDYVGKGSGYWGEGLGSLIEDLEKL